MENFLLKIFWGACVEGEEEEEGHDSEGPTILFLHFVPPLSQKRTLLINIRDECF